MVLLGFAVGDEGVAESLTLPQIQWTGEMSENGAALRGFYDDPKLADFDDGRSGDIYGGSIFLTGRTFFGPLTIGVGAFLRAACGRFHGCFRWLVGALTSI